MANSIILKKKVFESLSAFEERINAKYGYEPISMVHDGTSLMVLMKRINHG